MSNVATNEKGFVVIDALMAVLLLSLAGTALIATAVGLLQRETSTLDRSVSLVMSQSLMHQVYALGTSDLVGTSIVDELHTYNVTQRPSPDTPGLMIVELEVSALASGGTDPEVMLRFLTADEATAG